MNRRDPACRLLACVQRSHMTRTLPVLAAIASLLLAAAPRSAAAPWMSINQRQALLEERIDQGMQKGLLTRSEAIVLRGEFKTLEKLEQSYRISGGGLSDRERLDLDRRFDNLTMRIKLQKHDLQVRPEDPWVPINERQARIHERIDAGVRDGAITRDEAIRLRGDFKTLVALEAEYRRSGGVFTPAERADLETRLQRLSNRVFTQRRDPDRRY